MTPERIDVNDYDRARLIHAALTLYYGQELTQADVARRLGLVPLPAANDTVMGGTIGDAAAHKRGIARCHVACTTTDG